MVSAVPLWRHPPNAVTPGPGSRSGSNGTIFLRNGVADADPVELFEDDERRGLALIGLVVLAAIAVAMLGLVAQMLG